MNKTRRPIENKIRKKMAKAIKVAQIEYSMKQQPKRSDELNALEELKKYPKKIAETDKSLIKKMEKEMGIKKKKLHSAHHSKRTSPGKVLGQDAAPAIVHKESAKWEKTVVKQSVMKGKMLDKKMNKSKPRTK